MTSEDSAALLQRVASLVAHATLVQGVLHDAKNGLASIFHDLHALTKDRSIQQSRRAMERLTLIKESVTHLDRLLCRAREFGRWQQGDKVESTDVKGVIEEAIRLLSSRRAKIVICGQSSSYICEVPGNLLTQVFINLLLNSLEAKATSITIALGAEKGKSEEELVVQIMDNGTGIAEDILDRVFEPFFTTKESRVGFGLSVARQCLLQYGGDLALESKTGGGTTAVLRIPLKEKSKTSGKRAAANPAAQPDDYVAG